MKWAILAAALMLAAAPSRAGERHDYGVNPPDLRADLARLVAAYPATIAGFDDKSLILNSGMRLPLSDGQSGKSFDQLLDGPDVGDMFAFRYPTGAEPAAPASNVDPGRIRVEALFEALYGDCSKGQVARKMRRIAWVPKHGGKPISITTAQGVDRALEAVSRDLDALPAEFGKYLTPIGGTYNCRAIAKTSRRSMHGYGAAIDLNTKYSAYWQWTKPSPDGTYVWQNQMPKRIIDIFEKHGFVWGGRWYHYDTMHFEYRPDIFGIKPSDSKKAG